MFGVNLINLGFLAAAGAVSIPILIHLLMRPRARTVTIGTLRFLKLALKETTRRRKVRRWLLLALRMAAILLLALLFARPYFSSFEGAGRDREVIVLVDQSGSMSAISGGQTLFNLAQTSARKILRDLPEGTKAHLGYFDDRGVTPSAEAKVDSKRQPGYAGTDFGPALNWARDIFVTSDRKYRKVYLLTDLQRTGQHAACKNFPADAEIEVVELGKPPTSNLAVEKAEVAHPTIRGKEPISLSASVSNAGFMPAHNVQVRLRLESVGVKTVEQSKTISVAAGGAEPIVFSIPIDRPGLYQGYVEVAADDGFPADNRRWVAFEARSAEKLLLVDGEPGSTVFGNETYYLEAALRLDLPGKTSDLTPFEPERLAFEKGSHLPDLSHYQAIVLCNVEGLEPNDAARLREYVGAGGRLVIFTGGKVQPAGYASLAQAGLLPGTVEGVCDSGVYRFQMWNKDHPIFQPLSDPQQGDLRRIVFRKITRLKPAADAKILVAESRGNPLLLEKSLGRGKILLFASPADREWGDWPQSRLFVPIVHQFVGYLTDRLAENQRIHSEIAGPGADKPPGIVREKSAVAVRNLDARESRIERYTQEQFRQEFQLADMKIAGAPQKAVASVMPLGAERPDELWTTVVWILLAVLAIELFVANRTHA
jgi:hypothetical protein